MTYVTECLEGMREVLIATHKKPDGDAIGSATAWYHRLKREVPEIRVSLFMFDAEIPNEYRFLLDGVEMVTKNYTPLTPLCLLCLDTSGFDRLRLPDSITEGYKIMNIDHHISNEMFGTWNIVVDSSSVCEVSAEVFETGLAFIREEAVALYLGLLTDSGQFAYPMTTERTLELAGMLVRYGANPNEIAQNAYFNRPFRYFQLLARAIDNALRIGFFTIFIVRAEDLREFSLCLPDLEQFSSFTVRNKETEVGVLLIELEDSLTKCSFRSKGRFDVNAFAKNWGGGGHKTASGAYIKKSMDTVLSEMLDEIGKLTGDA